jgi:Flp pilus assembly protein TadD
MTKQHFLKGHPVIWALAMAAVTTGCATTATVDVKDPMKAVSCSRKIQPEHQVQLDLVDSLTGRSQSYAALARLESEGLHTEQHWLRYAQLLAATDQLARAEEVFRSLVVACRSADAYHGLGRVYIKQSWLEQGLEQLAEARKREPSSGKIRNDFGYALLLAGRREDAVFELRTAFELVNGEGAVRQNLAAAYLLTEDRAGLSWLKENYDFGLEEYAYAEKLSTEIGRQQ